MLTIDLTPVAAALLTVGLLGIEKPDAGTRLLILWTPDLRQQPRCGVRCFRVNPCGWRGIGERIQARRAPERHLRSIGVGDHELDLAQIS
nr:hypothetical protein [Rhodococcus wratislaviensis]GLK41125.1 hypothetical protein GCM10017611_80000 [Rhodococcus wratislaviensis]